VAEQLVLDQRLRNSGAIDGHERPVAARRELMDGAREQLLAGARLALQQDRRVSRRDPLDRIRDFDDPRRLADDRRKPVALPKLVLQQNVLVTQLSIFAQRRNSRSR